MTMPIDRARRLYARMNDALGRDIDLAVMTGEMTAEDVEAGVARCAGCTCPGDCETLLDRLGGSLTEPPGYCRNSEELGRRE